MIKTYNQRSYPNPFRYRKLNTIITAHEAFDHIQHKLSPFLKNRFSELDNYIDELGEFHSEIRFIRIVRKEIKKKFDLFTSKSNCLTKPLTQYIEENASIENYEKNLRYLELPVQPSVDKKGFELQLLSNEIVEELLEEIEDGYSSIYEYCSNKFPDSLDLWNDYALLNPYEFPIICHDDVLETTYEIFDTIIEDLQKTSINLFNWVISGDINSRVLKVVKPKLPLITIYHIRLVLESIICLTFSILLIKYLLSKYNVFQNLKTLSQTKRLMLLTDEVFNEVKNKVTFKKLLIEQKVKQIFLKINKANIKTELKYRALQILTI